MASARAAGLTSADKADGIASSATGAIPKLIGQPRRISFYVRLTIATLGVLQTSSPTGVIIYAGSIANAGWRTKTGMVLRQQSSFPEKH
jgi:hypothetical protein